MLYFCRRCKSPLSVGAEQCESCDRVFKVAVPMPAERAYNQAHELVYWPPQTPNRWQRIMQKAYDRARRATPVQQLAAISCILALCGWGAYTDYEHNHREIMLSTDIPMSGTAIGEGTTSGSSSDLWDGSNAGDVATTDPSGSSGAVYENPEARLSRTENATVSHAVQRVAEQVGKPGADIATFVPNDLASKEAASDLSSTEQKQLQQELSDIAAQLPNSEVDNKPKAGSAKQGSQTANPPIRVGAKQSSSAQGDDRYTSVKYSQPISAPPSRSQPQGQSPAHDLLLKAGNKIIRSAESTRPIVNPTSTTAPTLQPLTISPPQPASLGYQNAAHAPTAGEAAVTAAQLDNKSIKRLRHVYLGAKEHYTKFRAHRDSVEFVLAKQNEPAVLSAFVRQAVIVYPRILPSQRDEWKRDIIAMLMWKIEIADICKTDKEFVTPPSA